MGEQALMDLYTRAIGEVHRLESENVRLQQEIDELLKERRELNENR